MDINNNQLELFLTLEGYEGPIDLLLKLAREQKVDLSYISIVDLADQYIEFINNVNDIEIAADYLIMASWLVFLKSKLLLPNFEEETDDDNLDIFSDQLKDSLSYSTIEKLNTLRQDELPIKTLGIIFRNAIDTDLHRDTHLMRSKTYGKKYADEVFKIRFMSKRQLHTYTEGLRYIKGYQNDYIKNTLTNKDISTLPQSISFCALLFLVNLHIA